MKTRLLFLLVLAVHSMATAQEHVAIQGRITDSRTRKAVPYTAILLQGTSTGTQSNDAGQYTLKLPSTEGTVLFSAIGYKKQAVPVAQLLRGGNVRLEPHSRELKEVKVTGYVTPQAIIEEAVRRIPDNYHTDTTIGTWFVRDYRMLDGQLYLFDESVLDMLRYGYVHDSAKLSYAYRDTRREMEDNYKVVRKHRLLVHDSLIVRLAAGDMPKAMADMAYSDNRAFSDAMATPQANFGTAARLIAKHKYAPIQEYTDDDGVAYWILRGYGRSRSNHFKAHYTLHIRQDNFAVVDFLFQCDTGRYDFPPLVWSLQPWVANTVHNVYETEHYELRDGKYCLTHHLRYIDESYTSHQAYGYELTHREQRRLQRTEWLLTDLRPGDTSFLRQEGVLGHRPSDVSVAFGQSHYDEDFWGQYNTIALDTAVRRQLEAHLAQTAAMASPSILDSADKANQVAEMQAAHDTTPATVPPLPRWVFYRYGGIGGNRLVGDSTNSHRGFSQQLGMGVRLKVFSRVHLYTDLQYTMMSTKTDAGRLTTHSLTLPMRVTFDKVVPTADSDARFYISFGVWGRCLLVGRLGSDWHTLGRDYDRWDYGWSWGIGMEVLRTVTLEWNSYRSLRNSVLDPSAPAMYRHNGAFTIGINF